MENKDKSVGNFWQINENGKVDLSYHKFIEYLKHLGIYITKRNEERFMIRVLGNIICKIDAAELRSIVYESIKKTNQISGKELTEVSEAFLRRIERLTSKALLDVLMTAEFPNKLDTKECAYVYFSNCVVKILKDNINILSYSDFPVPVWEAQIINRPFELTDQNKVYSTSVISRFLFNCMGQNSERLGSLISILGFLIHRYKDSGTAKAVIFCDEQDSDNPEGGTGKSLTVMAVKEFVKVAVEDGKNFGFSAFAYQQVDEFTNVLLIEDITRRFNFENLFSVITDGIAVEKKYKPRKHLKFEDSPKVLLTTNYVITGQGNSFLRRVIEVEFSPYYNSNRTPLNEFGNRLFDGWDKTEWLLFDNFMIYALQYYLYRGIQQLPSINLDTRRIKSSTSLEFVNFASEIPTNHQHDKKMVFDDFINKYPDFDRWLTQRTFNKWLKEYANYRLDYEYFERKSNSQYYFSYNLKLP